MTQRMGTGPEGSLAAIPKVDRVLVELGDGAPSQEIKKRFVRLELERARAQVRDGASAPDATEIAARVRAALERFLGGGLTRVVNATGVVLHTNLGRAPLSTAAALAVARSARGYSALELDLETGKRGRRGAFAEDALAMLTGAEAALVVNNCAAAVLLVLGAVAFGKKVLVSRGELVEIGGGFRVPEVLGRSGAVLVEVGTTNKTRAADYAVELERGGVAALLRVHPGNFRQTGFVERPTREELAGLSRQAGIPLLEDLGGGALVDLEARGLPGEPTAQACVAGGADVVCFSTDKVLGGPQGGALVGRRALVERARRDPLARALRLGRLPLAALEATLGAYLAGRPSDIPALAALEVPLPVVRARADGWARRLASAGIACEVVSLEVEVGGGALAEAPLPSAGLALSGDAEALAQALRRGRPAVVGRIERGRLILDARTVLPGEDDDLLRAVRAAAQGVMQGARDARDARDGLDAAAAGDPAPPGDRLLSIGRLGPTDHATDVAGLKYVYPVVSRRAGGISVGVNLNPNAACNWRCVYCQVPGLTLGAGPPLDLPRLEVELDRVLAFASDDAVLARWAPEGARRLVDVAFSGDGEPTTSPDFREAIDRVAAVLERRGLARSLRLILITNGSLARKPDVLVGIGRLAEAGGEVWFKLDSATASGALRINGSHESLEHHLAGLRAVARRCKTWLQTCVVSLAGEPPSEVEQRAYLDVVRGLAAEAVPLEGVLLYTLARPSQQPGAAEVGALARSWLDAFGRRIEAAGLKVQVAG